MAVKKGSCCEAGEAARQANKQDRGDFLSLPPFPSTDKKYTLLVQCTKAGCPGQSRGDLCYSVLCQAILGNQREAGTGTEL